MVASRTPAGCEEEDSCRCEAVNGKNIVKSVQCSKTSSKVLAIPFVVRGPPKKLLKIDQNCTKLSPNTTNDCEVLENFCSILLKKVLKICSKSAQKCSKSTHNCSQYIFFIWRFLKILLNFAQICSFLVNCPLVSQRLKFKLFQHLISIDNWLKSICQVLRHL